VVGCSYILPRTPPLAAVTKKRGSRRAQFPISPLQISGFCSAKPKKNRAKIARNLKIVLNWRIFTTKLEPISSGMSEPRRLSAVGGCAPTRKPLHIFCNFPRRDFFGKIFLEKVKGVLVGCAVALATSVV